MAKRRETTDVTPFGYYLSSLIDARHFDNLTQFSEELKEVGRGATPQMVSRYRRRATVPLWFVADSIEVLELDEAETDKFVSLWLYTLSENERAVMSRLWKRRGPAAGDMEELKDYERRREERDGGENTEGGPTRD